MKDLLARMKAVEDVAFKALEDAYPAYDIFWEIDQLDEPGVFISECWVLTHTREMVYRPIVVMDSSSMKVLAVIELPARDEIR